MKKIVQKAIFNAFLTLLNLFSGIKSKNFRHKVAFEVLLEKQHIKKHILKVKEPSKIFCQKTIFNALLTLSNLLNGKNLRFFAKSDNF